MEYAYNKNALKIIRKSLVSRKCMIPNAIGVHVNTYTSWEKGSSMSLNSLLAICNYLRISVTSFISIDGNVDEEHVVVPDKGVLAGFKDCVFSYETMAEYLTKERGMSIAELCEKAKIGIPSYYLYFPKDKDKKSIITIDTFLRMCNTFKVWPGSFLTERGMQIPCLPGYSEALVVRRGNNIRIMTVLEKDLVKMKRNISVANQTATPIETLKKEIESDYDAKVKMLNDKHARSLSRLNTIIKRYEKRMAEQEARIKDLETQLVEARFYRDNYKGGYSARAAEPDVD